MTVREALAHQFAALIGADYCGANALGAWWNDERGSTHLTDWLTVFSFLGAARRLYG